VGASISHGITGRFQSSTVARRQRLESSAGVYRIRLKLLRPCFKSLLYSFTKITAIRKACSLLRTWLASLGIISPSLFSLGSFVHRRASAQAVDSEPLWTADGCATREPKVPLKSL